MAFKEYAYKEVGGGESLLASVWYSPEVSETEKPIAHYFHGGSWVLGHKDMLSPDYVKELLDLGFGAVVSPNYRLAPTISALDGPVQDAKDSYLWSQTKLPQLSARDANVHLNGNKIVTFGHSAGGSLALLMASMPQEPLAILDVFGLKYFDDISYSTPNPAWAKLPDFNQTLLDKIKEEVPPPSSAPAPGGPNGPDFTHHRIAWLFTSLKKGTWLKSVAPNGDYDSIDPGKLFSSSSPFPPTYFIHGSADTLVDVKLSERAFEALKKRGVDTELVIEKGAPHGFDAGAKPGDHKYEIVAKGFKFLADYAI